MVIYRGFLRVLIVMMVALVGISPVQAEDAEQKGLAIAKEAKQRNLGWGDSSSTLEMLLFSKKGKPALREMRILSLEVEGDGDKSLTIFDNPRDVQGTAFLSHTHVLKADDQWLYLPALKRVKRISSKNKTSPFMGSEFSYEDLNSFEVERFAYRWIKDEPCGEQNCFLVEMIPQDKYSGYSKQLVWMDQEHYRTHKVEFYDKRGKHLKTLELSGYALYLDKYWRPETQSIVNHKNNRRSVITMKNYQFQTGLKAADFTQNSLKRAR